MIEYVNLGLVNKKLSNDYKNIFKNFLKNGSYILGNQVNDFEREFANFCQTKF
jgi:dTDP-4-amino-4,6-dideoxygalactose transaminase